MISIVVVHFNGSINVDCGEVRLLPCLRCELNLVGISSRGCFCHERAINQRETYKNRSFVKE